MMKYHDEPPLEYIQQGYSSFFPKDVQRLGDNMFLVTYTQDRKGRSPVRHRSLMWWTDEPRYASDSHPERWERFGTIKRNRRFRDGQGINVHFYNYKEDNPYYSETWLMDTDENYQKATNLLVATGQVFYPEEFYDGIHCR
jgi:hypothetical protein